MRKHQNVIVDVEGLKEFTELHTYLEGNRQQCVQKQEVREEVDYTIGIIRPVKLARLILSTHGELVVIEIATQE